MFKVGIRGRAFTRAFTPKIRFNSTAATGQGPLSWVEYFQLKKQNSRINFVSGIFTGIGGSLLTLSYLGNIEIDVEKPILGFDPIMMMGGAVIVGGLLGYLVGPFIGSFVFRLKNKSSLKEFEVKNSYFLSRLKSKRPDPSSQSFSNPIPDYYGERIYSLKDYRQWLRDCNAFRRKAKEFL
ncbi:PAM17 [Candida oxycetoniae]|uniref:Presequence translocated-associated motor subunit PAM17 n=1 Tax=Candida oxycetoniae TaxID=497107 RepID=A0AAI9SYN5_9ASCO|nr:PAM17 [Candida oxycetoniae]KAI3405638.2 PAM17 [Candida oxycetoniae]